MSEGAKSPETAPAARPVDAPEGEVSGAAVDVADNNGVPAAESKEEASATDVAKGMRRHYDRFRDPNHVDMRLGAMLIMFI